MSWRNMLKLVLVSKPATCLLNSLPAKLLKDVWPFLGPTMLNIVNLSLKTRTVPANFKTAVVKQTST